MLTPTRSISAPASTGPQAAGSFVYVLCVVFAIGAIGALDWMTGNDLSVAIFYLAPVVFAAWRFGRRGGYLASCIGVAVWFAVEQQTHLAFSHPLVPWWNALGRLAMLCLMTYFVARWRISRTELQAEVQRQTAALLQKESAQRALEQEMAELAVREQARLSRELHDGLGQYLAGLAFRSRLLADDLEREASPHAGSARRLVEGIAIANRETRLLDRMLQVRADNEDLPAALRRLVHNIKQMFGVECTAEIEPVRSELTATQMDALFRIAQESLNNAIKHSNARRICLSLRETPAALVLAVSDEGSGLPVPHGENQGAGLKIMRYRAELIGAQLEIRNTAPAGCVVECLLPLASASGGAQP